MLFYFIKFSNVIEKEMKKMKPFPKWVAYLATAAALATTAWTTLHPGAPLPTWIMALTTLVATFSHSATGTGGQPN